MAHATDSAAAKRLLDSLTILDNGSCEPFKAIVHGAALGLSALMALYNAAAWLRRRRTHLAINAIVYATAVIWERRHVAHHLEPVIILEAPIGVTVLKAPIDVTVTISGPVDPIDNEAA